MINIGVKALDLTSSLFVPASWCNCSHSELTSLPGPTVDPRLHSCLFVASPSLQRKPSCFHLGRPTCFPSAVAYPVSPLSSSLRAASFPRQLLNLSFTFPVPSLSPFFHFTVQTSRPPFTRPAL